MNSEKAYYVQKFEIEFLRAKGNEFQKLFERVMSLAYGEDFLACAPWGKVGDRKNDGFLKSAKQLFQVYAPREMKIKETIEKITDDFDGAKLYWKSYVQCWTFVHNSDGLPPDVIKTLLEIEKDNPAVRVRVWGFEDFKDVFRRLSKEDLFDWFGPAPTSGTIANLGFKDLKPVLEKLGRYGATELGDVKVVPAGKIEANALSEAVNTLLKNGMIKTSLVEEFFAKWHDENLGERIASLIKAEYQRLRDEGQSPNLIFGELQRWVGGSERGTPEHELAVNTVLAYYFERCEIYEPTRESLL